MRFATILREAGFSPEEFINCAKIPIVLYDRKDRIIPDENVHYAEKLFHNNPSAYRDFHAFLVKLEKVPTSSFINVRIDEHSVVVFYKTPLCRIFSRHVHDSLDFMD